METVIKTPPEIIQELLALHATRREASEKLKAGQPGDDILAKLTSAAKQSDKYIAELMGELSNYGDAVMATVERENEYQQIWKAALGNIDSLTSRETAQLFNSLEGSLVKFYRDILGSQTDLPASLTDILKRQLDAL